MKTIAMEYSPENAIPYISKVDAGTIEMVKKTGVQIVSSMNLSQYFESRWSEEAYRDNLETAKIMRGVVDKAFLFMRERISTKQRITEYDVQQYMKSLFENNGLLTHEDPNCSVNANSGNPHYEPTKEVHAELHEGDFVLIDLWAKKINPAQRIMTSRGWDFLGKEVPEKYTKIFTIVRDARDAAVDFLKQSFAAKKWCAAAMLMMLPESILNNTDTENFSFTVLVIPLRKICMAAEQIWIILKHAMNEQLFLKLHSLLNQEFILWAILVFAAN